MSRIQIEENALKIDDEDMEALVSIFAEHGVEAEPIEQETWLKGAWWILVIHVVGQNVEGYVESIPLQVIGAAVVKHYKSRNRKPPRRIDLSSENGSSSSGDLPDE